MESSVLTIQLWPISLLYVFIFITELGQIPYMELHVQASFKSDIYNQQYCNISFNQTINTDRMHPKWKPGAPNDGKRKGKNSIASRHDFSLREESSVIN